MTSVNWCGPIKTSLLVIALFSSCHVTVIFNLDIRVIIVLYKKKFNARINYPSGGEAMKAVFNEPSGEHQNIIEDQFYATSRLLLPILFGFRGFYRINSRLILPLSWYQQFHPEGVELNDLYIKLDGVYHAKNAIFLFKLMLYICFHYSDLDVLGTEG